MKTSSVIIGALFGVILTAILGWVIMPSFMCSETQSPYSVEETSERLKQSALASGWVVPSISPLHESIKKHGGGDLRPVHLIDLCQANHAYDILKDDENKFVSVMMPCTVAVYQKSDGKTYISAMNAGLLGQMFGGEIARVMAGAVATDQQAFITAAIKQ